ncbi:MAG: sensor domain-containing protein [Betaproteobacteria bacterium]
MSKEPSAADQTLPPQDLEFARAVLDALPDHIYVKDVDGRYLLVNRTGLRQRKLERPEDIVGKTAYDLVSHEVADRMTAEDREVIRTGTPLVNREALTRFGEDGSAKTDERWHITTKIPMRDGRGQVIGVLGINRDITDRKRAELALRESEETFRAIFDQAAVGIIVIPPDLRFARVNDKFCEMLGYERPELLSMKVSDIDSDKPGKTAADYREWLGDGSTTGHELREKELLRKDGSRLWVGLTTSLVRAQGGDARYMVCAVVDISGAKRAATALRESEERFRQLAHHDSLTSLPNRMLFHDRLAQGLAQAARGRRGLGVMLIDLDGFKQVNDTLGHSAGDLLLTQVAARFLAEVRAGDTVARLGGDEFAIILTGLTAPQDAGRVAQKLIACAAEPFSIEGRHVYTGMSVGIALFPEDGADTESLLKNADAAMYQAKAAGRNCLRFSSPQMNARAGQVAGTDAALRQALRRNELVLHYQPTVNLATAEMVGAEALLRWIHPERGLIEASQFVPALDDTSVVADIGAWVLEAVCEQLQRWQRDGLALMPIAVNLFSRQLLRRDLASVVSRLLGAYQLAPSLLQLEMTERALMVDSDAAVRTLLEAGSLGVKSSIDDFGVGYSSLGVMRRLPLDALKIDRSFIRGIADNTDAQAVTGAAICLARSLGLRAIAKGVESEAEIAYLAAQRCDHAQGHYFARPMSAADFGNRQLVPGSGQA